LKYVLGKGFRYLNTNLDSSFKYALETFALSPKVSSLEMKAYAVNLQGEVLMRLGNSDKALELFREGLDIRMQMSQPPDSGSISFLYNQIGNVYWSLKDTSNAVQHYQRSMRWTPNYVYFHPLHEGVCNRLCNMGKAKAEST
jgi:tetratricopeptide (TPR) repeat protein